MRRRTTGVRVTAALALGVAMLAGLPGSAAAGDTCSDGGPCVVVHVVGAGGATVATQEYSAAQIAGTDPSDPLPDLTAPPYEVRSVPGGGVQDEPRPETAVSIQKLVTSVPTGQGSYLSWQSVTYAQVVDRDGHPHDLTTQQLGDPGSNGFADGLMPAVYVVGNNDAIGFIRPLIDDNDVNAPDFFQTDSHAALTITLHTTGAILHPTVVASTGQTDTSHPVSFTVSFPQDPGTQLTYAWNFQDGTGSPYSAPKHTWKTAGTYYVSVTVTGADGSSGQSAGVPVQVGTPPPPTPTPTPTTGGGGHHHHHPHPTSGPTSGGGHHQGGQPTSGPTPTTGPSAAPSAAPTSAPTAGPASAPTAPASAVPTPQQPETVHHRRHHRGPSGGRAVSGRLLLASQVYALPPTRHTLVRAASEAESTTRSAAWGWLGVLAVPLLAGLGMAGESLQLRRRLARMGA